MRLRQAGWSIDPGAWSVANDPECLTVCPPANDAALQISSSWKTAGKVLPSDVADMAQKTANRFGKNPSPATCGTFVGLTLEYADGGHSWRRWWVANGHRLLFVTYNAAAAEPDKHRQAVDRILSTLVAETNESEGGAAER